MSERTWPARVVTVDYICDECGEGLMQRADNMALMSSPPRYWHQCNKCGHRQTFTVCYPFNRIQTEDHPW